MNRQPASAAPRFPLGRVVATPGALDALAEVGQTPVALLVRHQGGDWGELPPEDVAANEEALLVGGRLLSAYTLTSGVRLWIITEWDRSITTLLLPSEY